MKKVLLVFGVSAALVVLLASAALAQTYGDRGMSASPMATASATATATASPTATASALPTTGGPPLVGPLTWVATLTLVASGVGAMVLLRRGVS
jgi:hypothetical protein